MGLDSVLQVDLWAVLLAHMHYPTAKISEGPAIVTLLHWAVIESGEAYPEHQALPSITVHIAARPDT